MFSQKKTPTMKDQSVGWLVGWLTGSLIHRTPPQSKVAIQPRKRRIQNQSDWNEK